MVTLRYVPSLRAGVLKDTGRLLAAFVVGAIATVTASVIAAALVPMKGVIGGWKIAAALCSRHIGGAINYVAVSDVLSPPPAIVTAGIAADNVVVAAVSEPNIPKP